ncbi:MAG: hypothetical protein KGQ94_09400, partial [Alphaproteobacteria bacterium]|nr:hypothetical protein [Alphaproteobacteria bacterium]
MPGRYRDAREQLVRDDREIGSALALDKVVRAIGSFDITSAISVRLLRVELDGAADRVLSGERALRPAQNFHPIQVE